MNSYQHLVIWMGLALIVFRFLTTNQRQELSGWTGNSGQRTSTASSSPVSNAAKAASSSPNIINLIDNLPGLGFIK